MFLTGFRFSLAACRLGKFFFITALILAAHTVSAAEETSGERIDRALKAFSSGQRNAAMVLATKAIEADSKNARAWFVRGRFYEETRESAKALPDYDQALKLDQEMAEARQHRGFIHFKLAHI